LAGTEILEARLISRCFYGVCSSIPSATEDGDGSGSLDRSDADPDGCGSVSVRGITELFAYIFFLLPAVVSLQTTDLMA